jgi:hypothetical protein
MSIISYLVNIPLLLFFTLWFRKKFKHEPLRQYYDAALVLKIAAGISLALIYLFYYNMIGDTFDLYERSTKLTSIFWNEPKEFLKIFFFNSHYPQCNGCDKDLILGFSIQKDPRTIFYIKVLSIVNIFTFSNFWITSVYLSFFSFLGFYQLSNSILKIFNISKIAVALSFLFFPSVLLWSSGVMKESIVMGSMAFLICIVLQWLYKLEKVSLKKVLFLLLVAFIVFKVKYYYFAILIPVLASFSFVKIVQERNRRIAESTLLQLLLFLAAFGGITLAVSRLHPNLNLDYFSEALIYSYDTMIQASFGKNIFYFEGIEPGFANILGYFPEAVFTGLFRPFIWETHNLLGLFTALENLIIFIFFVLTLVALIVDLVNKKPVRITVAYTAMIVYVVLLAFIIPIASPNWGSLARYKIGYLPFLILLLSIRNPFINLISKKLYGDDIK